MSPTPKKKPSRRARAPKGQRRNWDVLFRFLKTIKLVRDPGRHVTGDRTSSNRPRRNPWPLCDGPPAGPPAPHRVPDVCPETTLCPGHCPGHPHKKKDEGGQDDAPAPAPAEDTRDEDEESRDD